MGLLTILKKLRQKEREVRILMLGLDNAGKTTILKRMTGQPIDTISPTLGFNIQTLEYRGFKLNIWDVGGQKSIRSYWRNYFEQTDAVVWVVDSADIRRLELCRDELRSLLLEERLAGAPVLILANKQDLPGALSVMELRKVLKLDDLAVSHHFGIQACSAFADKACILEDEVISDLPPTGDENETVATDGIVRGFSWLVDDLQQTIFLQD